MLVAQQDMTITQYYTKAKSLCRKISKLDPASNIFDSTMRRIIICGLSSEYRIFVFVIQGWPIQPSLVELENLLADQEALIKQMVLNASSRNRNDEDRKDKESSQDRGAQGSHDINDR